MLTDRIKLSGEESNDPEDIFASSLAVIFPDDITNMHGDTSHSVIYLSPSFGPLTLTLADPKGEDSRKLYSHFLWNAGLQLAEFIEDVKDDRGRKWEVEGERVLELGAGTGLAGIVAGLKNANEVVISDYPAPEVLANTKANVQRNVEGRKKDDSIRAGSVKVQGHEWGILDDAFSKENKSKFSRLLVADCLWMPWQHGNLLKSISWFLNDQGKAWVIAGFHTGRAKMRGFYEERALSEAGLEIESIWERNADGGEREWVFDRGIEDITERKRWLAIGILRKRAG